MRNNWNFECLPHVTLGTIAKRRLKRYRYPDRGGKTSPRGLKSRGCICEMLLSISGSGLPELTNRAKKKPFWQFLERECAWFSERRRPRFLLTFQNGTLPLKMKLRFVTDSKEHPIHSLNMSFVFCMIHREQMPMPAWKIEIISTSTIQLHQFTGEFMTTNFKRLLCSSHWGQH